MLQTSALFLPLLEFVIFFFFLSRFYVNFMKKTKGIKSKYNYISDRSDLENQVNKFHDEILYNSFTMTVIFGTVYFLTIIILKRMNLDIEYITTTYTDGYLIYCTLWCSLSLVIHQFYSRKLAYYIISFALSFYLPFANLRNQRGHAMFLLRSIISLESTAFFLGHLHVLVSLIIHLAYYIFANYCTFEGSFKIRCHKDAFELSSNVEYIFAMLWLFNYSFRLETRNNRILSFVDRSTKVKMEFLSRMSQKIRTPLFGILGSLDLLKSEGLSTTQKSTLKTIRSCCERLSTTIRNVLDLSRIEYGKILINESVICLTDLVDECINRFLTLSKEKGIEFKKILVPPLPRYFVGDKGRIKQILMNLISNAINFNTKDGLVEFTVTTDDVALRKHDKNFTPKKRRRSVTIFDKKNNLNGYIHFVVRDTGIGIEKSLKERISHPFVKIINPHYDGRDGIGLGLTIAKHFAKDINGSLEFYSEGEDKGSIFWLSVPYKVPAIKKAKVTSLTHYYSNEAPTCRNVECTVKTYKPKLKKSCSLGDLRSNSDTIKY